VNYYLRRIEAYFVKGALRREQQQRRIVCDTSSSASP